MKRIKTKILIIFTVLTAILCHCSSFAQAVPITIQISGKVTSFSDDTGLLNTIHVNDTFGGTYTYDTAISNTSTYSNIGKYVGNPPCGISLSIGGFEFKTDPIKMPSGFEIGIGNDVISDGTNDFYYVQSLQNSLTSGLVVSGIYLNLSDSTHTAISSIALPVTAPILSTWNQKYVAIYGGNEQDGFYLEGTVEQAVLIPEPATAILLMAGAIFLRRRSR